MVLRQAPGSLSGLLDLPFVFAAVRVMATTLALGGVIFLAMPRQAGRRGAARRPVARHLTGFDEEVKLGQLGEILENDSVVMSVEFTDRTARRSGPPVEPLWRGVTMAATRRAAGARQFIASSQMYVGFPGRNRPPEAASASRSSSRPNDSETLFAIRPIRDAAPGPRHTALISTRWTGPCSGPMLAGDTTITRSSPTPIPRHTARRGAAEPGHTEFLLEIPDRSGAAPQDRRADRGIHPENRRPAPRCTEHVKLSRATGTSGLPVPEAYFRSGHSAIAFTWTSRTAARSGRRLPGQPQGGALRILRQRLALLLRSIDIPARMVNGFKGGDWNDITQILNVRQKHAHSWVEAYRRPRDRDRGPIWITLDPTPCERARAVDRPCRWDRRELPPVHRPDPAYLGLLHRGLQRRPAEAPALRPDAADGRLGAGGFHMMVVAGQAGIRRLFRFEDISAFISWRGVIVTFMVLLLARPGPLLYPPGSTRAEMVSRPGLDSASLTAGHPVLPAIDPIARRASGWNGLRPRPRTSSPSRTAGS